MQHPLLFPLMSWTYTLHLCYPHSPQCPHTLDILCIHLVSPLPIHPPGCFTIGLPQNYKNKNEKKENEKKQGGDQKEYVALMHTVKLKRSGVGFLGRSRESGVGILTCLVHLVLRSVVPWCTTSLTKNESIGERGKLKREFLRLSVRD